MADIVLVTKSHANATAEADPVTRSEAYVDLTKWTKFDLSTLPEAGPIALSSLILLNDRVLSD